MTDDWTVLRILEWTAGYFADGGLPSPRLEAEVLLAHTLGLDRIQLYVQYDRPLTPEERGSYRALVRRRASGEPTQYITGTQEFWSIPLQVEPGVLIPRPETEVLVEEALAEARRMADIAGPEVRLADVGTGSGCIAIALATELSSAHILAGDIADVPLRVAAANVQRAGLADRVRVVRAAGLPPLVAAAGAPFHVVVSNPPYLADDELPTLMREVRDHEPRVALTAGPGGLELLDALVRDAATPGALHPGGALAVELAGATQAAHVASALTDAGFVDIRTRDDYAGTPRVVVGRRPTR